MSSLPASMKRIRSKTTEKMWWRSFPHYKSMGIFFDAQGQLTLLSVVGSGRISNSCKLLCMSSLPASIKRIRSKTVEKTWWRPFPHYNPMGAIRCHGNQRSDSKYSKLQIWASSWDYGTYHIGDQRRLRWACANHTGDQQRLRWACAGLPEPSLVAYMISTIISRAGSNTVDKSIIHGSRALQF